MLVIIFWQSCANYDARSRKILSLEPFRMVSCTRNRPDKIGNKSGLTQLELEDIAVICCMTCADDSRDVAFSQRSALCRKIKAKICTSAAL